MRSCEHVSNSGNEANAVSDCIQKRSIIRKRVRQRNDAQPVSVTIIRSFSSLQVAHAYFRGTCRFDLDFSRDLRNPYLYIADVFIKKNKALRVQFAVFRLDFNILLFELLLKNRFDQLFNGFPKRLVAAPTLRRDAFCLHFLDEVLDGSRLVRLEFGQLNQVRSKTRSADWVNREKSLFQDINSE